MRNHSPGCAKHATALAARAQKSFLHQCRRRRALSRPASTSETINNTSSDLELFISSALILPLTAPANFGNVQPRIFPGSGKSNKEGMALWQHLTATCQSPPIFNAIHSIQASFRPGPTSWPLQTKLHFSTGKTKGTSTCLQTHLASGRKSVQ